MEVCRRSSGLLLLLGLSLLASTLQGVQGEAESEGPSESECRPYIEKALKELETGEPKGSSETGDSREDIPTVEITTDDSDRQHGEDENDTDEDGDSNESAKEPATEQENDEESGEVAEEEDSKDDSKENKDQDASEEQDQPVDDEKQSEETTNEEPSKEESKEDDAPKEDTDKESAEQGDEAESKGETDEETESENKEDDQEEENESVDSKEQDDTKEDSKEDEGAGKETVVSGETTGPEESKEDENDTKEDDDSKEAESKDESVEQEAENTENDSKEDETSQDDKENSKEDKDESKDETGESKEEKEESKEEQEDSKEEKEESKEQADSDDDSKENKDGDKTDEEDSKEDNRGAKSAEDDQSIEKDKDDTNSIEDAGGDSKEKEDDSKDSKEAAATEQSAEGGADSKEESEEKSSEKEDRGEESTEESGSVPEEELSNDIEVPTELRPREHVEKLLKLDDESSETEKIINKVSEITLKELKKLYENAIKPLEVLYKYRDLSNRHFGDAEIFSKPLILFMGPWSGGKSSIINYLVNNEYNETALRTGAEPSPAYFNILMYGEEPEVIDGTELAADFTFSGLQKFGQGLEERLRGVKLPNKLLEKVNIVEIPGILEVRKQVSRVFPFNDACQWFIDRADIIFLVYDPSKLDVGPETEAILDQLKGREHQTRIILNKADQVKPEELMRVQGALIWNISPLMSSPQPPTMYTTSLWSRPYEPWAPVKLLQAQERAFLRDLRTAVDKRIENKIASARRFAVRVRNHAKMVDCYLTTYYNHKSVFGNRKQVADEIIEHPQDYHIYEGLSTLTNISRYDLPDPEVYKDFFKLNPLYDFQQLSATCTYFRGCPINRLDVAIAYDLPELVGNHKKLVENALAEAESQSTAAPGS